MPKETLGVRLNNPGNIEKAAGVRWQGAAKVQQHRRFMTFESPEMGIRAIARTLITYQDARRAKDGSKIDTVADIIERWAPPSENNTSAYAEHVAAIGRISARDVIDVYNYQTMRFIIKGIIAHENAGYKYPDDIIDKGIGLAGVLPPKKPLSKSRTVVASQVTGGGSIVLGAGAVDIITQLSDIKETAHQLSDTVSVAAWVVLGVSIAILLASGLIFYARHQDDKKRIT